MGLTFFKFCIVLFLCGTVSSDELESLFKDGSSLTAIADGVGVIDISGGDGRADVQTRLNLSPWEMFVIAELVLKVIGKQCPKISPDVLSELTQTLSKSFKQAPMMETQNEEFLPNYSRLVRCLDHFEEKDTVEEKKASENVNAMGNDISSQEEDWIAKDAVMTTEDTFSALPLSTKIQKSVDDQVASSWLWGFRSMHSWFRHLFSSDPDSVDAEDITIGQRRQQEQRREHKNRIVMAYRKARQNHANFFHKISQLLQKSCPAGNRPEKLFIRQALLDINTWMTLEPRVTISGAIQWFRKEGLDKMLDECHRGQ